MEQKIKTLGTLHANHFNVDLDVVRLRTGKLTERLKLNHPQAAAVVAFTDPDHILMVRQWRYAIGRETLEIPAGKADPGEDLAACAIRELREEAGYEAARTVSLFRYYPAIGYSDEMIQIYAAGGLTLVPDVLDVDEISKVEVMRLDKVYDLIIKGSIQDGKTTIGISLFLAKKEKGEIPEDFFQ